MTRTSSGKVAVGVVAGVAATLAWTGLAPVNAGGVAQARSWTDALRVSGASAAAAATAETPDGNITGAQRLVFVARTARGGGVDTGARGDSPGDYFVFEDRLTNAAGARIGSDSARCMLVVLTIRCDGTFFIDGRGTVEVSGSFTPKSSAMAVTGGTGDFRNVRGQARITGSTDTTTDFVLSLLP